MGSLLIFSKPITSLLLTFIIFTILKGMAGGASGSIGGAGTFGGPGNAGRPGAFGSSNNTGGAGGFGGSTNTDGSAGFGGSGGTGIITVSEANKWKQDAQYAFNKLKQVECVRNWIGFRQIDLNGADSIIHSTDVSNEVEVARILIQQCTADRAAIKAQFRTHMHADTWTAVFGK